MILYIFDSGMTAYENKNYKEAIHEFTLSLRLDNDKDTEILNKMSYCYFQLNFLYEGMSSGRKCLQINENDVSIYLAIALAQMDIQQFEYAEETIDNYLKKYPTDDLKIQSLCDEKKQLSKTMNSADIFMRFLFINYYSICLYWFYK
jgi:tetratricopeptide (TPR) repeat protein